MSLVDCDFLDSIILISCLFVEFKKEPVNNTPPYCSSFNPIEKLKIKIKQDKPSGTQNIAFITDKSDIGSVARVEGPLGFLLLASRMTEPTG